MPTLRAILKQIFASSTSPASGAFWLGADRAFRLTIGLLAGLLVIRHLGPADNGLLQTGLALAAMLSAAIELGLESVLRRELVRNPHRASTLLGTAFLLRLAVLGPAVVAFLLIFRWETGGSHPLLGLWLAITLTLPLVQALESWLLATDHMRESAIAGCSALGISTILRLALVAAGAAVTAFGAVAAVEVVLVGLTLWIACRRFPNAPRQWSWDRPTAGELLRGAAPLLCTNIAVLVYRRCDIVMVTAQLDTRAAGLYAAAVKLSELGYIPPMILFNAWFPRLTRLHAEDPARYQAELARFFRIVTWLGVAFAAGGTLAAPWLVRRLFGPAFADAAAPFAIHAWTAVFIAQGIVRSQWLLLENRLVAGLVLAVAGAVTNLTLNALLISRLGPNGAALSAVIALALNLWVFTALSRRTRPAWVLGWRAFFGLPLPTPPERP
jgi:PST family polysaccharide transporter